MIRVKRIYDPAEPDDGYRVLIDRLWPRGVSKSAAAFDLWLKEIAPSTPLRSWFAHDHAKWHEFQARYVEELERNPEPVARLLEAAKAGPLTLLYAARDEQHNHAPVLRDYLQRKR